MKNNSRFNRGSINSVIVAIIAVIVIVAIAYFFYEKGKSAQVVQMSQENNLSVAVSTTTDVNTIQTNNTVTNSTTPTVTLSGTSFKNGDQVVITWSGAVVPSGELPSVVLFPSQQPYSGTPIVSAISANTYTWIIPSTIQSGTYYVQVYDENNANTGAKSKVFTITNQNAVTSNPAQSLITVTSPKGGETFNAGQQVVITWQDKIKLPSVNIMIVSNTADKCSAYTNNGSMGTCRGYQIYTGSDTGSFNWTVPTSQTGGLDAGQYLIRIWPGDEESVRAFEHEGYNVDSYSNYFTITN